jgi:hypothetical protein
MRLIPFRTAAIALLVLFGAAIVFQVVVLAGYLPTGMVWGGRLQNDDERTVGALVSIAALALFALLVLVRMGGSGTPSRRLAGWGMWLVCALFALNTLGNLAAMDLRETLLFTPITLVAALLAARVAMGE